jgi:hypothetical protein
MVVAVANVEAEHSGRADPALVAHEPAERAGERAGNPRGVPAPPDALDPPGQLRDTGQDEQSAEHDAEGAARYLCVQQRARETAESTRYPEGEQHAPVHMPTQDQELLRGADNVRDGDRGDGHLGTRLDGEHRGEHAPDTEAGDRSGTAGDERHEDQEDPKSMYGRGSVGSHQHLFAAFSCRA